MLPVSLVEVQDENYFNPQAFLAGLLPGNYGTLLPPHPSIIPHLDPEPRHRPTPI